MIDSTFVDEAFHSFGNVERIRTVQLKTFRRLVRTEVGELDRLVAPIDERPRVDHFANVQSSTELLTNRPEPIVRYTSHWRPHDRRPYAQPADVYGREYCGVGGFDVTLDDATVD